MYNGCSWLPEPLKLNGSVNDEDVENNLYELFLDNMKNGNIIETGSHKELMNLNGFYAELYHSQYEEK